MKCEVCNYPDGSHSEDCVQQIIEQRDAYWVVVKYFKEHPDQALRDITANLLKEG